MPNVKRLVCVATVVAAMLPLLAHAQVDRYDALANSPMNENRPTPETSKLLRDELLFQRATQTFLWALPLINTLGMKTGSEKTFGAGYKRAARVEEASGCQDVGDDPHSDVIYAMSYLDLGKDGAMVFEAAPGLQGILLDFWQRPIPGPTLKGRSFAGDVGLPGPDEGKGGKFLILPPGYKGAVSPGYFVYRSDTRIWFFTDYYSISPGMISQTPGKGAKYMVAFTDSTGTPLSGGASYRVKLPPNIPAENFWSLTLYETENASGLANGQPFPSLGSRDKPAQDADGSVEIDLGPQAPAGKQANWLATVSGKGYFAVLRLYGPTEVAINKSWKPGDIEREK